LNNLDSVRADIRKGYFQKNTSGIMPSLVQGNVVIMPKLWADEFIEFCKKNPTPCPLIGVSPEGSPSIAELGDNLDIRIDLPEYNIFTRGELSGTTTDILSYWRDDSVAMVLGCSFSFENALQSAGLEIINVSNGTNVSMYDTSIPTKSTHHFNCNMVVSMRPFKEHQIDEVILITSQYSKAHGAPVHVGDPEAIGIKDINKPEYGSPVPLEDDDIPVFWGCGVTTQAAIKNAKLPLVITHAPGKMLITDFTYPELMSRSSFAGELLQVNC
jgi:uncharacterized protein YcsI (UPF0317 family)